MIAGTARRRTLLTVFRPSAMLGLAVCVLAAAGCGGSDRDRTHRATRDAKPAPAAKSEPPAISTGATLGDLQRIPGKVAPDTRADVVLTPGGGIAVAWFDAEAGAVTLAQRLAPTAKTWDVSPVADARAVTHVSIVAGDRTNPEVAWIDRSGLHLTGDPTGNGTPETREIAPGSPSALDAALLAGGSIAIATLGDGGATVAIVDPTSDEHRERTLQASSDARDATTLALVAYGDGYAMAYPNPKGRLTIATASSPDGRQSLSALDVTHGTARIAVDAGGTLHVLYGGATATSRGSVRYWWKDPGARPASWTLLDDLECDSTGNLIGIAPFTAPLLLYGYGCDVGWAIQSAAGKDVSPARLREDIGRRGFLPTATTTTGSQLALVGIVGIRRQLAVQLLES